jgi:hypothetical protein
LPYGYILKLFRQIYGYNHIIARTNYGLGLIAADLKEAIIFFYQVEGSIEAGLAIEAWRLDAKVGIKAYPSQRLSLN